MTCMEVFQHVPFQSCNTLPNSFSKLAQLSTQESACSMNTAQKGCREWGHAVFSQPQGLKKGFIRNDTCHHRTPFSTSRPGVWSPGIVMGDVGSPQCPMLYDDLTRSHSSQVLDGFGTFLILPVTCPNCDRMKASQHKFTGNNSKTHRQDQRVGKMRSH